LLIIFISFLYIGHLHFLYKNFSKNNENIIENDELLNMCYKSRNMLYSKHRNVNESNLFTIQSKLNYLMIHESPDYKSKIADKIMLHDYSIKKLGKDICVPIIKIYNDSKDINLDQLPEKFVLKCNHGSGMNILCNNKSDFDINKAKIKLNLWKNINYGLKYSEFQYINIDRKIFAEIFLKENIEDYKIYCFHGIPKYIRVQKHLIGMNGTINNYYDLDWKLTDIETGARGFYRKPDVIFEKPKNLDLMIKYSKKLSEEFVFVRVDFYNINGKIYLGEMTFSPSNNGFPLKNRMQSLELGKLIDIKKINKKLFN
jgi:hypothetical protein